MIDVQLLGLKEIDAALRALPDAMQAAPVRAGLKAGAAVLADGMGMRAPRDPHVEGVTLAEEIVTKTRVSTKKDTAITDIGPSKRAFYGGFQELGTRHHAAQPFMRPTLEHDAPAAIAAMAEPMKAGIHRAAKRLARRRT